jgi:hypothetical protein
MLSGCAGRRYRVRRKVKVYGRSFHCVSLIWQLVRTGGKTGNSLDYNCVSL